MTHGSGAIRSQLPCPAGKLRAERRADAADISLEPQAESRRGMT